jgi:putative protein-disulfide isomerase
MKYKLIYVYDALCGWCYGFSPTIRSFVDQHKEELEVEVISGGMITGDRIGPIGEVAGYIKWAYKEVEQKTGVKFGTDFLNGTLEKGTAIFTSLPPAIALSVFKSKLPNQQLAFAARLQQAIYYDGIAPRDFEAYGTLAEEFGLDNTAFQEAMTTEHFLEKAYEEFNWSKQRGITGFPTVVLQKGQQAYAIAKGAVPLENLEHNFQLIQQRND